MKERPILFSAPMVRAILEGRKTQTRRVVKPQPVIDRASGSVVVENRTVGMRSYLYSWPIGAEPNDMFINERCPYGVPGDRLWVKETWRPFWHPELYCSVQYAADSSYRKPDFSDEDRGHRFADLCDRSGDNAEPWHPSIHMWRELSRLTLEVVSVRVERLQDINEEGAKAEGAEQLHVGEIQSGSYRDGFQDLWESINGAESWDVNPWVWVVEFRRVPQSVARVWKAVGA